MAPKRERLDDIFLALSHGTRRKMLARLLRGDALVSELARLSPISLNSAHKHIAILERAGFVSRDRSERVHFLALRTEAFDEAIRWVSRHRPLLAWFRKR